MDAIKVYCPHCNAEYKITHKSDIEPEMIKCDFCLEPFIPDLNDSQRDMLQKEKDRLIIKNALDMHMEKTVMLQKLNELCKEESSLKRKEYQMPVIKRNEQAFKVEIAGISSPFLFGLIAIYCISGKEIAAFLIFALLTVACVPVFRLCICKLKEETSNMHARTVNAETERELFISNKERELESLSNKIAETRKELEIADKQTHISFLIDKYQTVEALRFIYDKLSRNPDYSLHEALYYYDVKLEKDEKNKREEQLEADRIRREDQRESEKIRLEDERARREDLFRAELIRREAELEFRARQPVTPNVVIQQNFSANNLHSNTPTYNPDRIVEGKAPRICPNCHSGLQWHFTGQKNEGFSGGKAAVGFVFLGPLGLLAGAAGKPTYIWHCDTCNFTQRYREQ